jgi:anti-anti-sigma factor
MLPAYIAPKPYEPSMKSGLTISESRTDDVLVLKLSGYLDGHTFVDLEKALDTAIKGGSHRIVIDLAELTYIASAGVGVFINSQHQVRKHGGSLQLVNPAPTVREVFGILGLEAIFTIHLTVDQGVRAARK